MVTEFGSLCINNNKHVLCGQDAFLKLDLSFSRPNPFRFHEGGDPVPLPLIEEERAQIKGILEFSRGSGVAPVSQRVFVWKDFRVTSELVQQELVA